MGMLLNKKRKKQKEESKAKAVGAAPTIQDNPVTTDDADSIPVSDDFEPIPPDDLNLDSQTPEDLSEPDDDDGRPNKKKKKK